MSEVVKEVKAIVERETKANARQVTVRLNELVMLPELFCHRGPKGLDEASVADLFDSLTMEGLQVPVEFYVDPENRKVLTKGHRRVTACRILARENTPHFSEDMEIPAIEVHDAPLKDLVVRSVADNMKRKTLDNVGRLFAVRALHTNGVAVKRGAVALGVSEQSYKRDLSIVENEWMLGHVLDDRIAPTHAASILQATDKTKRTDEVRADIAIWVARVEAEIQKRVRYQKERNLQELPEADRQVKKYLTNDLLKHWLALIEAGKSFDDKPAWGFRAGIDPKTNELFVGSFKVDLAKESPKNLARMMSQLSQLNKDLLPIVKKRKAEEDKAEPMLLEKAFDLQFLRDQGLADYADEFEEEREVAKAKDGEEDPTHGAVEERVETDLVSSIELPQSADKPVAVKVEQATPAKDKTESPAPKTTDSNKPAQ